MVPSEVKKIFRAFAEERKRALPQFTPDGIPITLENKFDDAIYNYLYAYWKEQSGEYDPKKDVIPESEMNKMHPKTKNEKKFEQWLLQQYGMTKKEEREYTLEGNLDSLWEIFSAADMVLFARGLPSIGKELAQLGKKAVDDVAEEAVEKTVKKEATEEMADTAEDLSQKTVKKENALEDSSVIKGGSESVGGEKDSIYVPKDVDGNPIPLAKQTVNGQDIPLPDPNATGPHTVLGGKVSSETGEIYRQSATFPEGTWPPANGQNVPWSEVHWTNHGRGDHTNPHQHIFEYNPDKGGWIRGKRLYFED